jgi:acylphosphatase
MSNRAMVKLIHADGFYNEEDAKRFKYVVGGLKYTEKDYGYEIENFNMIQRGLEPIFSRVLGEKVIIDQKRSGLFRRPKQFVHFEDFETLNEWCFVIALEKTTFNMFHHLKDGIGENGDVDAKSALDGWQYNYRNLMEWNIETNVMLEENQGVFFRPWMFHSLDEGKLVQYYRLLTDRSLRILVMGRPGQGKTELAKKIHEALPGSLYINSEEERVKAKDIDYSLDGQSRHTYRILEIARKNRSDNVIIDMSCPIEDSRDILNPDVIIWVDKNDAKILPAWEEQFEAPKLYDFRIKRIEDETLDEIVERVKTKKL